MFKADAVSRIECVQGRMPEVKFKDYEALAEEIADPRKKAEFVRQLSGWRALQVHFGVEHVPWPGNPKKPADPKAVAPWNVKVEEKAAKVPVLPKPEKVSLADSTLNRCSEPLMDMVSYFNAGTRVGRGNLLWCGWNASHWGEGSSKTRTTSPAAGAHLVMVSTEGARFLHDKLPEIPNCHMGNFLAKYCGGRWQEELGAAYLEPSIGSYTEHESSTSPGQTLMNHFDAKWVQEGTRPMKAGDRPRFICAFTAKGPAQYLHKNGIDLNNEDLRGDYLWMTEAPPGLPESLCGVQQWHEDCYKEYPSPHTHGY